MSAGLLLARAYAVTDHKRLVLALLCILGVCTIVPDVVCAHVFISVTGMCNKHLSQTSSVLDGCEVTSAHLHTVIM